MKGHIVKALLVLLLPAVCSAFDADMQGSKDHPEIPRVQGTFIIGYDYSVFDAGRFIRVTPDNKLELATAEGKRTRLIYIGDATQSSLQLFRNYQTAFNRIGEFEELYSCQRVDCEKSHLPRAVWTSDSKFPSQFSRRHEYYDGSTHKDAMYVYGTLQKGETLYHVSVFTAMLSTSYTEQTKDRPVVHLEIVEVEEFEPSLDSVDAAEMSSQLEAQGRIALYGIRFEFDSAKLQPSSAKTIEEVARALKDNQSMSVYVVGHTDNAGEYDYNRNLSQQRAAAVVQALIEAHGIGVQRLVAIGVGPVAPRASNDSEDGRAINRRVEIVRR
jgi:outer membrane protein OmpA-like peptidoglycan-associated protein